MAKLLITVQDVIDEFGRYVDNGQNRKDIKKELYGPNVYESLISDNKKTNDLVVKSVYMTGDEILQAFQCAWTPKGGIRITPNKIILQEVKIDIDLPCMKETFESWLGFLDDGNLDYSQKPFVAWLLDEYLYPRHKKDREIVSFSGSRVEPTTGIAGATIASVDGFNTILKNKITDGKIIPIVSGVWPTDPVQFVTALEAWTKNIDPLMVSSLEPFRMAPELVERLKVGNRAKYNTNYQLIPENMLTYIFDTKFKFAPDLETQRGSQRVWTTIKGNSVMRTKHSDNINTFRVKETSPRQVNLWTEYYLAYGFWVDEWVITNEQE